MAQKKGLGKGLDAFFGSEGIEDINKFQKGAIEIDINKVEPNREQPRKFFEEMALNELANSILEFGIIQPLIVKKENDYYSIIAGERRWRAARIAKIKKVPIIIKDYTDIEVLEVALIENIQRSDLNPIEEAWGYKKLIEEYNLTQEQVAKKIGKNRSTVSNCLRLLSLDARVQNFIVENRISMGHARAILSVPEGDLQFELAEKIIEESLSVRDIEGIVRELLNPIIKENKIESYKNRGELYLYKVIETDLKTLLGTKVNIKDGKNKGKIEIEYYNNEELDRILMILKRIEN